MRRVRTSWIVFGIIIGVVVAASFLARVWLLSHDRFNWRDNWNDMFQRHQSRS